MAHLMIVHVYRNLNNGVWSVRYKGKVIFHLPDLFLVNVTFHVQPAGRDKTRKNKHKNVHAYAKGELVAMGKYGLSGTYRQVSYDPYINDTFVDAKGREVHKAVSAYFSQDGKLTCKTPRGKQD